MSLENGNIVKLSASILALIWAIVVGLVSGLVFIIRLDSRVSTLLEIHYEDRQLLQMHISQPGHPVAVERTDNLMKRVEKIEHGIK